MTDDTPPTEHELDQMALAEATNAQARLLHERAATRDKLAEVSAKFHAAIAQRDAVQAELDALRAKTSCVVRVRRWLSRL